MQISFNNNFIYGQNNISHKKIVRKYNRMEIKRMVDAGKSLKDIANFYGLQTGQIRPILKRLLIEYPESNYRIDLSQHKEKIESLIQKGYSAQDIANLFKLSESKIRKWILQTYNHSTAEIKKIIATPSSVIQTVKGKSLTEIIETANPNEKKRRLPSKLLKIEKSTWQNYINQNMSVDDIAEKYKTTKYFISQILRIQGLHCKGMSYRLSDIKTLFEKGITIDEMVPITGLKKSTIKRYIKNIDKGYREENLKIKELVEKIKELSAQGKNTSEIAEELKVSAKKIYYYSTKYNVYKKRAMPSIELLQKYIKEGKTNKEIGEITHYTESRIYQILAEQGIKNPNRTNTRTTKSDIITIVSDLSRQGYSIAEIAKKMRVSSQTICRWKKDIIGQEVFDDIRKVRLEKKREELKNLIDSGISKEQLLHLYGKSRRWIEYITRKLGIERNYTKKRKSINIEFSTLLELKEKGFSQVKIAKELGVSRSWVSMQFKKARLESNK